MFRAKCFSLCLASQYGCQRNNVELIIYKTKAARFLSLALIIHNIQKSSKKKGILSVISLYRIGPPNMADDNRLHFRATDAPSGLVEISAAATTDLGCVKFW